MLVTTNSLGLVGDTCPVPWPVAYDYSTWYEERTPVLSTFLACGAREISRKPKCPQRRTLCFFYNNDAVTSCRLSSRDILSCQTPLVCRTKLGHGNSLCFFCFFSGNVFEKVGSDEHRVMLLLGANCREFICTRVRPLAPHGVFWDLLYVGWYTASRSALPWRIGAAAHTFCCACFFIPIWSIFLFHFFL